MTCNNEWDPLQEVIVGTAIGSKIPKPNKSLMSCVYTDYDEATLKKVSGLFPKWLVDEQEEDLGILSDTLEKLGVKGISKVVKVLLELILAEPTWLTLALGVIVTVELVKPLVPAVFINKFKGVAASLQPP